MLQKIWVVLSLLVLLQGCFASPKSSIDLGTQDISSVVQTKTEGATHHASVISLFKYGQKDLISVSSDGQVLFWSLGSAPKSYELFRLRAIPVLVSYSDETKLLAAVYVDKVELLHIHDGSVAFSLSRIRSALLDSTFSQDGRSLLLAGGDGIIYRWKFVEESRAKLKSQKEKSFEQYFGLSTSVSSLVTHPQGRLFFSGDWDGGLNAWLTYDSDRLKGAYDENLFGQQFFAEEARRSKASRGGEAIQHLEVTKDGQLIVATAQTGYLEVWKVRGFKLGASLRVHDGEIFALAVSPDGHHAATSGRDGKVVISSFRKLSDKELQLKEDRTADYELKSVKEESVRARSLVFSNNKDLLAGLDTGEVVQIQVPTT